MKSWQLLGFNIAILTVFYNPAHCSECGQKIKYSIKTFTPSYTYETSYYEEEVITPPKEDAFSITVEENVDVLCKGMVNVNRTTHHFYAWKKGIKEIEAGTFENQKLDAQLYLSSNYLKIIKKGTFKNILITDLDLSYNEITTIEVGAIEDLPNLSVLELGRNKIMEFHPNSVINTPKLLFFDMSINNMEELKENHFRFMSKERNVGVGVASNELRTIHPKAFAGIDVFNLGLSDNKLESIPKEVFSGNVLHYLSIAHNKLTHLEDAFFKMNTTTLRDVELEGNPFDAETTEKLKPFIQIIEGNKRHDAQFHFF